ncbi:MAG: hypothetical protein WDM91_14195 [Rhizomicrobium sp.]
MHNTAIWRTLACACVAIGFGCATAHAEAARVLDNDIACAPGTNGPDIVDVVPQLALNDFGAVHQQIGAVAGVYTTCDPNRNARWDFEGTLSAVSQPGGVAYSGLLGVGYEFKLWDEIIVIPLARLGFDHFPFGETDAVESGEVAIEANLPAFGNRNVRIILDDTPSYTGVETATTAIPGPGKSQATFANLSVAGVDFPVGHHWRMKTSVAYNYIADNGPVNSIGSAIVSLRDEGSDGKFHNSYEVEYSHGDGHFDGVLFSIDFHWE